MVLDFIQEQISSKMPNVEHKDDTIPNEMIMECSHLFQELSDLSIEGEDEIEAKNGISSAPERPLANAIDIPLEDDIEIGSLELNILDGRPTDISGDTAVPTVNEYATYPTLKTEEDFYQEAVMFVKPLPRDSDSAIEERRLAYASMKMRQYQEKCIQEGVFGHDKLKISDQSVPATTTVNFGPLKGPGSPDYYVKLPIKYQVDKHQKVLKKQVEAITIINEIDAFKDIKKKIHEISQGSTSYELKSPDEIWEHATPVELRVPEGPSDKYVVMVVVNTEWEDKDMILSCTISMKGVSKKADIKSAVNAGEKAYKSKKEIIKEQAELEELHREMSYPDRFGRRSIFQEAIDFGNIGSDNDMPPASGTVTPDTSVGNDNPPTPSTSPAPSAPTPSDSGNNDATTIDVGNASVPTPTDNGDVSNDNNNDDGAIPVETNDVSDQIADKVASETQDMSSTEAINNDLNNMNDSDIEDGSSELGTDIDTSFDDSSTEDINNDNNGDVDLPGEENNNDVDMSQIENMSIEDLINQGSEKLKTLSIGQLKSFLSGENSDAVVEEAFQEAFFLTSKNITREIYKELKRVLGILNESKQSGLQILDKFKKNSRALNRALAKGSKMNKVYSESERMSLAKLNKCLMDLNVMIGSGTDSNYASTIKRLIDAFLAQSQAVVQILGNKDPEIKRENTMVKGNTNVNNQVINNKKGGMNNV